MEAIKSKIYFVAALKNGRGNIPRKLSGNVCATGEEHPSSRKRPVQMLPGHALQAVGIPNEIPPQLTQQHEESKEGGRE
jgi:hypothetical protein